MNFITQKHLHRRTVLKGLGATIALPFLDAMTPALRAQAAKKVRLVAMEMVHGAAGSTAFGLQKNLWAPAATGSAFDLSPTSLAPGTYLVRNIRSQFAGPGSAPILNWPISDSSKGRV